MTKKELIHDLKEDTYCRIMPSKIHGVGVFAIKDIPKGTWIFKSCRTSHYYRLSKKELKELPKKVEKYILDMCRCVEDYYLVPKFGMNNIDISYFVNHSKKPNLGTKKDEDNFFALRNIKSGEELFTDYQGYSEECFDF
jgi:SET domain-containing protein